MAAQAVLIAETIAGMKKAVARGDDASDSDDSVHQPTNRGNKLKRKARYVHEGQLSLPNGPRVYRRKIEHAGYERYIINRNPPRFDEDGDELDDDDVDEQADANAAEENPYSDIRLEYLLAPLTSAADLPHHPSLSIPYLSNTLTELAQEACQIFHKENASLARIQQIMTKFRGDETWIPCGNLQADNDFSLFGSSLKIEQTKGEVSSQMASEELPIGTLNSQSGALHGAERSIIGDPSHGIDGMTAPGENSHSKASSLEESLGDKVTSFAGWNGGSDQAYGTSKTEQAEEHGGLQMPGNNESSSKEAAKELISCSSSEHLSQRQINAEKPSDLSAEDNKSHSADPEPSHKDFAQKPETDLLAGHEGTNESLKGELDNNREKEVSAAISEDEMEVDADSQPALHRMTTRAQAQAASEKNPSTPALSLSSSPAPSSFIHPLFIVAPDALPDRDFGLPPGEAEDTRRLLLLYVQKQEEICRGAEKLYSGLLRADRMRKLVLSWSKAEAHVGEMSDGEDWYDKEEWDLEDDLKKGHGEDDDDSANQGKKTRGRRA
ncbi:hypothetical protein L228DRAFT_279527 [Xylona heveae TC161]|uniref:Transcriptional regulatory protein RXT2 N-terminal domain-containing protein n=1 Tax=Xylona heveae (strain CBS 132557 / TC161) TaxID=1328760 RepID=A0A165JIY8_XYLHT|nr:hypothetical protein L228DRAFT_279527 [Xylona heveae TC161]KZF26301.1 hypothetical protein L228DRAFT_279527 [Xylona heveae TC161]